MTEKYMKYMMLLFGALLAASLYSIANRAEIALYSLIIILAVSAVLFYLKKISVRYAALGFVAYFVVFIALVFYAIPTAAISNGTGTILNNNWWSGLNWIEQNTAECATIATYWDPGHFIRAIAKRPVVFDGASQNAQISLPYDGDKQGFEIIPLDHGINQLVSYGDGELVRARIKDIAIVLMTSNEDTAVDILKDYRNGCDEMYFLASADLIPKSVWWSYFATWDPTTSDPKGRQISYSFISQARRIPIQSLGVIGFEYPVGQDQSFILCQANGTISPCSGDIIGMFKAGNQFARLSRMMYPAEGGVRVIEDPNGEITGTIFVPGPEGSQIIYIPEEFENSIFTKMFFFDGLRLERFDRVGSWGNEFKLYRVNFD